jgi:ABC-2 type transport system permease protein
MLHSTAQTLRNEAAASFAFVERYVYLLRRYIYWEVVFQFYTCVNTLIVAYIGVAGGNSRQVLYLMVGAVLWAFLSIIFQEVSDQVAWERWEGTLEYTFMAPLHRVSHLFGMCMGAVMYGILRTVVVLVVVAAFLDLSLAKANMVAAVVVLLVSSLSFIGLGLLAAVLPLISHEKGAQGAYIIQACILLVSGVYYEVTVLPPWLQKLSMLSPATYTLRAMRDAVMEGKGVFDMGPTLLLLTGMGLVLIPLGLWVFQRGEHWARRNGMLSRSG